MTETLPSITPAAQRFQESLDSMIRIIESKIGDACKDGLTKIKLPIETYGFTILNKVSEGDLFINNGYHVYWETEAPLRRSIFESPTWICTKKALVISWNPRNSCP